MFVSMSRTIGYSMSPFASANQCVGPMSIIWWTAGVSGIEAPAIRASFGLQTPHAITTTSVSMSPVVVRMPRTRPPSTSIAVTSMFANTDSRPTPGRARA